MQIGTTDTASLDLDLIRRQITSQQCRSKSILEAAEEPEDHYQDIVFTQSGNRDIDNGKRLRLLISEEGETRLAALKGGSESENNFEAACWDVAPMIGRKSCLNSQTGNPNADSVGERVGEGDSRTGGREKAISQTGNSRSWETAVLPVQLEFRSAAGETKRRAQQHT